MNRVFSILAIVALAAVSCEKPYTPEGLRVQSRQYNLSKEGGSTPVIAYAGGHWKAYLSEPVSWARLERTSGESGVAETVFHYDANEGVARKVGVVFKCEGRRDTVYMLQAIGISNPSLSYDRTELNLPGFANSFSVNVSSNLGEGATMQVRAEYPDPARAGWIKDIEIAADSTRSFSLDAHDGGATARTAYLILYSKDAVSEYSARLVVNQTADVYLDITASQVDYPGGDYEFAVSTNMASVIADVYAGESWDFGQAQAWARVVPDKCTAEKICINFDANPGYEPRSCTLTLNYTDASGKAYSFGGEFSQSRAMKPGEGVKGEAVEDGGDEGSYNNWEEL